MLLEQMYATGRTFAPLTSRRPAGLGRRARTAVMVGALCLLASFGLARAVQGTASPVYATVTVQPGDSVWSIASTRYPGDDPRERVDEIIALNGLSGPQIEVGEALKVPAR